MRRFVQWVYLLLINAFPEGFWKPPYLYQGGLKHSCVPVLQCYSCPATQYGCPIGALQNTFTKGSFSFPFYVFGFLAIVGALVGKMTCGWLCPFGLLQDLMYKLTHWKNYTLSKIRIPKIFNYLKYVVLALLVVLMPLFLVDQFDMGSPWFCKILCPAGTFGAGIPMVIINDAVQPSAISFDPGSHLPINLGFMHIGKYFGIKVSILIILLVAFLFIRRPFCRFLCPLGAIYGAFNKVSIFKMKVNDKCISCDKCYKVCPMEIKIYHNDNSENCIRCLDCVDACPVDAISWHFTGFNKGKEKD